MFMNIIIIIIVGFCTHVFGIFVWSSTCSNRSAMTARAMRFNDVRDVVNLAISLCGWEGEFDEEGKSVSISVR